MGFRILGFGLVGGADLCHIVDTGMYSSIPLSPAVQLHESL